MSNEVHTAPIEPVANGSEAKRTSSRAGRKELPTGAKTKSETVVALLSRSRGATIDEMMSVTGWQAHSVRGFIAGTVKKKLGRAVTSEVNAKGRFYRIVPEAS